MMNDVIETRSAEIWLAEDGIFHVTLLSGAEIRSEDVKEILKHLGRLSSGKKVLFFADIRGIKSVTRESRLLSSSAVAVNLCSAAALLIGSPVSRVIGNFFLGINKPPYPIRIFTSEEEAIKWLKEFAENQDTKKKT